MTSTGATARCSLGTSFPSKWGTGRFFWVGSPSDNGAAVRPARVGAHGPEAAACPCFWQRQPDAVGIPWGRHRDERWWIIVCQVPGLARRRHFCGMRESCDFLSISTRVGHEFHRAPTLTDVMHGGFGLWRKPDLGAAWRPRCGYGGCAHGREPGCRPPGAQRHNMGAGTKVGHEGPGPA